MAFLFLGLPLITFVALAALATWQSYLKGLAVFAALAALAALALYATAVETTADAITRDTFLAPLLLCVGAAAMTLPAQAWRAWCRGRGQRPHYLVALFICLKPLEYLFFSFVFF